MRSRNRDYPVQHGETPSLLKIQKISRAWWCMPVVPAAWEAEAEELLEGGKQSRDHTPLHSSLAIERDSVSKKERKKERKKPSELETTRGKY